MDAEGDGGAPSPRRRPRGRDRARRRAARQRCLREGRRSPARRGAGPTPARTSTSSPPRASRSALAPRARRAPADRRGRQPERATACAARTHNGIALDLRIVPPDEFGNLLQHFTGSKEHNVKLRERAVKMGLSVSEHGIADVESGEVTTCEDESGVYERLGLAYIEPELREGRGRDRAPPRTASCPSWSRSPTSAGDLHCHTTLSDGKNTLDEMAEAARSRGYSYLAITDHSATPRLRRRRPARRSCDAGSRRSRSSTTPRARGAGASSCSPAPRSTSSPTARSTTRTSCSASSTGWSPASTRRSGSAAPR